MSRRAAILLAAGFAVVVGLAVLAGWVFGIESLKAPLAREPIIPANTAVAMVLIGTALWLATFREAPTPKALIVGLSGLVVVIGMASWSGATFVLLGGAMLARQVSGIWWRRAGDVGALGAAVFSMLGLIGHLFGVLPSEPLTMAAYRMAPATALVLLGVAAGVMASGRSPWLAGLVGDEAIASVARLLLPAVVFAPVVIGLIVQDWESAGLVDDRFGDALIAVGATISLGMAVVWATARATRLVAARGDAIAQAAASDYQYRIAVEAAPAGMLLVDAQGKITLANRHVTEIFGYTAEELVGQPVEILLPDQLRGLHVDQRSAVASAPSSHRTMGAGREFRGRRKDGGEFPVEIGLSPLAIGDSNMVLAAVVDITARRRLEDQFRQAQKMEAVGRLAGGVAHDFNNILTAILGHADFLGEVIPAGTQAAQDLDGIKIAGRRAAELTRQLLVFSRHQVLAPTVFPLSDTVVNAEKMLRRIIGEDIELVTRLAPDTGCVLADPGQVGQVLMNLVVNARDAMPHGGRLTIETGTVDLDGSRTSAHGEVAPGRYVMLAVSDTGVGMNAETQARLFEPFFTTKEVGKGTGLGLATVYGIVKQSGGHIWVYSEPGKGSVFKVHLPLVAPGGAGAESSAPAPAPGGHETVLVVEDDASVRAIAVGALGRRGYRVLVASGPEEALRLFDRQAADGPIHALITDVVMPGMSGPDLARAVRRVAPEVRLLFTSGYTQEAADLRTVIESGLAYLQKPYTIEGLWRKTRDVLDAPPGVLPGG